MTEKKKVKRTVPTTSERSFDAPDLVDDYYLNLLDWGQRNNTLAVGLGASVFLFDGESCKVSQLVELQEPNSYITSVSWSSVSGHLAVGTSDSVIQIWDVEAEKLVRRLTGHTSRVGALAWRGSQLSSGSRSGQLLHQDVNSTSTLASIQAHSQELCGLKWSADGSYLASGGNDNILKIWNLNQSHFPKHVFSQHKAAVKALAWCPYEGHSNILASGGGSADGHIRIWNAHSGACIKDIDAQSQVCSLQWGTIDMELISSHGFSKNEISIWQYPTYEPLAELTGHSARVLHTSLSPDGNRLVSLASDETLRFWRLYNETTKPKPKKNAVDIKKSLSAFEHPLLR
jgi:cell division cycle protein 20 (cofactor of APC complex)